MSSLIILVMYVYHLNFCNAFVRNTSIILPFTQLKTLFPTVYFFHGSHGEGWHPSMENPLRSVCQITLYTVNYTDIRKSDPTEFFPSFKTLDLVAKLCSPAYLTYASNFRKSEIYKRKLAADF
jgi:hypothetical protein